MALNGQVKDFKKKMDSLDAKRRAAEESLANGGMDPDELKALREARDKNPELQATLEALKSKTAENDKALEKAHVQMQSMRLGISVNEAINDYNKAHPTTTLKPDMADLVTLLAKDALRYDEQSDAFVSHPGMITLPPDSITAVSALSGGQFASAHGHPVTVKGVC